MNLYTLKKSQNEETKHKLEEFISIHITKIKGNKCEMQKTNNF